MIQYKSAGKVPEAPTNVSVGKSQLDLTTNSRLNTRPCLVRFSCFDTFLRQMVLLVLSPEKLSQEA